MKYISNAMKFGTQSRSSLFILNVILGNPGSPPKIGQIWAECVPVFMKHANYECCTWN